jgi:phage tail-like protein
MSLISTDPIVSQNFFLELDGAAIILSGVSGFEQEIDVVETNQVGANGMSEIIKTRGTNTKAGDLTITRMAPLDAMNDPIWQWFTEIRDKGMAAANRADKRKNGSIVLYDVTGVEVGRFNFFNGWPSKIATDGVSAESNDPLKETITLVIERLDRVK